MKHFELDSRQEHHEILIVKYGMVSLRKSQVFLNYFVYGESDEKARMDYYFWIIRTRRGLILVDTGFTRIAGESRGRTVLIDPVEACRLLGFSPEEVKTVIVTHAHYDHIGNVRLFPQAEVIISAREYAFWTGMHRYRQQFSHSVEDADIKYLEKLKNQGQLTEWEGAYSAVPGVTLLEVGGHTPGQAVVLVNTRCGTVLLASDAVHFYEELERDRPFVYVADLVAMYEGYDMVRQFVESHKVAHVIPGHDPAVLDQFTPVDGPMRELAAKIGGESDE